MKRDLIYSNSEKEMDQVILEAFKQDKYVQLICDYSTVARLMDNLVDLQITPNEFYSINMSSDVNEYLVSKDGDKSLIVEKAKYRGSWKRTDSIDIYVLLDLYESNMIVNSGESNITLLTFKEDCDEYDTCLDCKNIEDEHKCETCFDGSNFDSDEIQIPEEIDELISEFIKMPISKELLYKLYEIAYTDGAKTLALSISNRMTDIVEG